VTNDLLVWLLVLPLAAVGLVPATQRGPVAARFVVLTFAVGAMHIGAGGTSLAAITSHGRQSPAGALFVSLTAGLLLGGTTPWPPRGWRSWVAGAPLVLAAAWAITPAFRAGPYLLGVVLGAIPVLLGTALPSGPRSIPASPSHGGRDRWLGWSMAGAALVMVSLGSLVLVPLAALLPLLLGSAAARQLPGGRRQLVLPGLATVAALLLVWLALTIAGDAMAGIAEFFVTAPVSPAAERWLGLLAVMLIVALLAPWPMDRFGPGVALAPAAVVFAYRVSVSVVPGAIGDWQPLLGMLLVPLAVVAALRDRWAQALMVMATFAALRPGPMSLIAVATAMTASLTLMLAAGDRNLLRPGRVTFAGTWWLAGFAAAGCAAAVVAVLPHEVVLATLLAGGLACAAARTRAARPAPDPTMP
jgi:hypothetical protein